MEKNSSFQWFGIKKAWEQLMGVPILFWPIALPVIVVKVALYVCLLAITLFMTPGSGLTLVAAWAMSTMTR